MGTSKLCGSMPSILFGLCSLDPSSSSWPLLRLVFSVSGLVPLFMTIVGKFVEEVVAVVLLFKYFSFRFEVGVVGFEGGLEYTLGGGNSLLCLIRH